jgi:glycerate kinase
VSHVLAAPDKFKGTATATALAAAIAAGAAAAGWSATELPLSDGGEGLLDVTGGPNRQSTVTGPSGYPVTAAWRLDESSSTRGSESGATAVIEMAQAAGLVLAGGRQHNDALAATTAGVGMLIIEAAQAGATRIIVGCGGSATTDGGAGALAAISNPERLAGVDLVVACDVTTRFIDAAGQFGPQKGASPEQVTILEGRLASLANRYAAELGRDVTVLDGSGAAGGLAGGLAAIGGRLVPGFELVAWLVGLDEQIRRAEAVVTGEGCLDAQSFSGKVVGGVAGRSDGRPALCVAGRATPEGEREAGARGLDVVSLSERFGETSAVSRPLELVATVVAGWLADRTA